MQRDVDLLDAATILARAVAIPRQVRGIYFLVARGEIVYIGQTPSVFRRLAEHMKSKAIDAYYLLPLDCDGPTMTLIERRYIDSLHPRLNVHKGFWQNIDEAGGHEGPGTKRALRLIEKGATPYAAAKKEKIALSTIYRALKRKRERAPKP